MFSFRTSCVFAFVVFLYPHMCGAIHGIVSDTNNRPVVRALVTFIDESYPDNRLSGYTETDGSYAITFESGIQPDKPVEFRLYQNYPNPFNPCTTIPFSLEKQSPVTITIYTIMGQKVRTLINGYYTAGLHSVTWDRFDEKGKSVGTGIYICQLRNGSHVQSIKMLLLDGGGASGNSSTASYNSSVKGTLRAAVKKPVEESFRVTITGKDIVTYEKDDILLTDSDSYNFVVSRKELDILGISFVSLTGGIFQMGGVFEELPDYCGPVHSVTVSPFKISAYEITNEQYTAFLNEALASKDIIVTSDSVIGLTDALKGQEYLYLKGFYSSFPHNECKIMYNDGTFNVEPGYEIWPVVWVTWSGAKAFAHYYRLDLPTEAEWEYAAQIGEKYYIYSTYDETFSIDRVNYLYSGIMHPVDVGSYPPNPFGIYDMTGNVWEWCNDWFEPYGEDNLYNPTGPDFGDERVARGGSFNSIEDVSMVFYRLRNKPDNRSFDIGFRVVRR